MPRSLMVMVTWWMASGRENPKIPVVGGAAQIGVGIAFHRMVEARKAQWVTKKEHRGVVAHNVPVSLFGVEFDRKTADVALCVCRAAFSRHGGKAHKALCLFANLGKYLGLSVFADIVGDGEGAKSARTFRVHAPFGDHLAVEMSQFFHQPNVLHQKRAAFSGSEDVVVVRHRGAGYSGEFLLFVFFHVVLLKTLLFRFVVLLAFLLLQAVPANSLHLHA